MLLQPEVMERQQEASATQSRKKLAQATGLRRRKLPKGLACLHGGAGSGLSGAECQAGKVPSGLSPGW